MNLLLIAFLLFPPLEEAIPSSSFTYPGKHMRETLIVDRQNSPRFDAAYAKLANSLMPEMSEEEILWSVGETIESLFDRSLSSEEQIYSLAGYEPVSLEAFLEAKVGNCRHFALTTGMLLERLTQSGWLSGEVALIREELPSGRHGWILFVSDHHAWHFDSYWGVLEDLHTEKGCLRLASIYSKRVIDQERSKVEHEN